MENGDALGSPFFMLINVKYSIFEYQYWKFIMKRFLCVSISGSLTIGKVWQFDIRWIHNFDWSYISIEIPITLFASTKTSSFKLELSSIYSNQSLKQSWPCNHNQLDQSYIVDEQAASFHFWLSNEFFIYTYTYTLKDNTHINLSLVWTMGNFDCETCISKIAHLFEVSQVWTHGYSRWFL